MITTNCKDCTEIDKSRIEILLSLILEQIREIRIKVAAVEEREKARRKCRFFANEM